MEPNFLNLVPHIVPTPSINPLYFDAQTNTLPDSDSDPVLKYIQQIWTQKLNEAIQKCILLASHFRGATSPNPPVGAVALNQNFEILSIKAHQKAGLSHAESQVLEDCYLRGLTHQIAYLFITLEPCTHQGKTPPCCDLIVERTPKNCVIIFGTKDPNPNVSGNGQGLLTNAGYRVLSLSQIEPSPAILTQACEELIAPFEKKIKGLGPWIIVKQAFDVKGSMIPEPGKKTFTSQTSLKLAHLYRKRTQAILTGNQTVLNDHPEFTVRHIEDHVGIKRWLVIADRTEKVEAEYLTKAQENGFQVIVFKPQKNQNQTEDWRALFKFLNEQNVQEILIEAGPKLTEFLMKQEFWDQWVVIQCRPSGGEDYVYRYRTKCWNNSILDSLAGFHS